LSTRLREAHAAAVECAQVSIDGSPRATHEPTTAAILPDLDCGQTMNTIYNIMVEAIRWAEDWKAPRLTGEGQVWVSHRRRDWAPSVGPTRSGSLLSGVRGWARHRLGVGL